MTASIEHLRGLHYRLTTRIPIFEVEGVFERELRRRGASDESSHDTRQRARDEAWEEALDISRRQTYQGALRDSELRAVSEPEFSWVHRKPGEDCVFTATFEVLPSIDLSGLTEVEIEAPVTEITDADVTRALELLRSEHKTFKVVARPSRPGDRVKFDFEGTLEGASFAGGSGKGVAAVLGAGDVLDDMETALTDRSADDAFDTPITFPQDYALPTLRGESAEFHIAIHSVAAPEFPELDPDFVRQLGVASGSLDELREQVRERLESECERTRHRYERRQMTEALLAAVPVTVPDILLSHELERVRAPFQKDTAADQQDSAESKAELPEEPLKVTAERRVTLSLILSEIIRQRDIRLDQKRVEKKLDELAARFALTDANTTKRQYRENKQVMHNVQALVIEEQGFEAALQSVRKTPVSMSFDALLQASE